MNIEQLRRREGEKWSHYPDDVLPAWVADMDFEIAAPIRAALEERLARSDCGYPVAAENTGLPELLSERLSSRFDWAITPGQVDLFNDVVQAIYFGLLALSNEGDGVVIQTPIYPPFIGATNATKRHLVLCPLVPGDDKFEIDFAQMRDAIGPRTRILLLCNPHNPSGRCFARAELEQLGEIALRHNLDIISDEIHADLVYAPNRHIPIASLSPEIAARTVTLMSASKAFNIAGICMAFAIYGHESMRQKYDVVPRHLRGGVSALSIAAVTAAFTHGQPWLDNTLTTLRGNRDFLHEYARAHWPNVAHFVAEATYLAWLDFRACDLSSSPYRYFLEHAKVALGDGGRFGEPGHGFARVNFATSREILHQILERMNEALNATSTNDR